MKSRRFEIDGDAVTVIDGLFDRDEISAIYGALAAGPFRRTETDNPRTSHIRQFVMDPLPGPLRLASTLQKALAEFFPKGVKYRFHRGYCNSLSNGDMCYPHRDCDPDRLNVTVLVYPNPKWDRTWGGETMFYDSKGEVALCVLPKPGRVVVFPGRIEHRAGAPLRDCHEARLTLAYKYAERPAGRA